TRKKALSFLVGFLLLCVSFPSIIPTAQAQDPQQLWALIICGSEEPGSFPEDAGYMYHVLSDHYDFDGIYYLHVYTDRPGVDALSTRANVRSAITNWLGGRSSGNDIIFIYFTSHGGGYHITDGLESGRVETVASDEGNEQRENTFIVSFYPLNTRVDWDRDGYADDRLRDFDGDHFIEVDINDDGVVDRWYANPWDIDGDGDEDDIFIDSDQDDLCDLAIDADTDLDGTVDNFTSDYEDTDNDGRFVGIDLNQDGDQNDWVGIDECMQVQDGLYWDDELASDLNTLNYAKLIFVRQGCVEEGEACFGGGIIDDISAKNRIIMTATDETHHSYGLPTDAYSYWSRHFIDALHGEETHWDNDVVHETPPVYVDADWSNDGNVSMWDAWEWAWDHDEARPWETPWLDDNFNGEPTYIDEDDDLDQTDGLFSMETYLGFDNLRTPDINEDCIVNIYDMKIVSAAFGSEPGDPDWNPNADLDNDDYIGIKDMYFVSHAWHKCYSDPPSPVSMETVLFTHPILTVARKGESFSVNLFLFNVENLHGWELQLYWNNAVLNCTSAEIRVPDVWGENVFELGPSIENSFNATYGRCSMAVSALYSTTPSFNGSMVVATLTFEARAAGNTILDLQETKLADSEACAIPHIAIDGLAKVRKR
ncbi:MAG: hypothetical protein OEY81_03835, partial [Candidatus Bathyarchaeota archaeon]|nr:hypothetical protein [Candidatus Bathyarchaeota archaeon]